MTEDLIILTYHRIAPAPRGAKVRGLFVAPTQFARHLAFISRCQLEVVTFRQLLLAPTSPAPDSPARTKVVLTFDDGSQDFLLHAAPLLHWYGYPAVVFPVVGDIGRQGVVWPQAEEQTPVDLLTDDQLRGLHQAGMEIGSHLVDHVRAPTLSPEALIDQLCESRERLMSILHESPVSVAYPYGAYDDQVITAALTAGYRFGVTTETGNNAGLDEMRLRRLAVRGTRWYHPWQFKRRLTQRVQSATR